MTIFKNGLIIRSNTKKDVKLPATYKIYTIESKFALDSKMEYLYKCTCKQSDNVIIASTISPLNEVKNIEYKKEIKDMAIKGNNMFLLNDYSLTLYSKTNFNVFNDSFKDYTLIPFYSVDNSNSIIAVQNNQQLQIFDENLIRKGTLKCQCAFSMRDILLIGDMNILKIYLKIYMLNVDNFCGRQPNLEFSLPDFIVAITTDILFSKIYCATQDNKIYVIDLNGEKMGTLNYHDLKILKMKLSFCGKYLYSHDSNRICVW